MNKKEIIEKAVAILLIIIVLCFYMLKYYNVNFIAILVLIVNIYTIIKYRKNPILFFVFICMLYFDYSVIMSKYIGQTYTLQTAYNQIQYNDTMYIGIGALLIFHAVILLFLSKKDIYYKGKDDIFIENTCNKKNNIIALILTCCITVILVDYLFLHLLSLSRTIYEYLLVLFVLAFYYSKDNKFFRKILFVLMMVSTVVNMSSGGRIISLQPMIAYFFINYYKKINFKNILIICLIGIIIFTIAGLYGDYIAYNYNLKDLNFTVIKETFENRQMTLDTAISSYWTGLTFVEITNIHTIAERVQNFVEYITLYTIGGTGTGYTQIYTLARQYYTHYYGGYLTSYFYYWLGWVGVIGVGILIGKNLKMINKMNENMNEFKKIYIIYFISSLPRWYLYYPTALIRGTIILFLIYQVLRIITKKKEEKENVK